MIYKSNSSLYQEIIKNIFENKDKNKEKNKIVSKNMFIDNRYFQVEIKELY